MKYLSKISLAIVTFILMCFISYSFWSLSKKFTYSFMYENMVQQTIKSIVKPEALK